MRPSGIYPILYSYFDASGQLDRTAMRRQIECCLAGDCHGIAILGLITEVGMLKDAERRALIEWTAEDLAGRKPLAVTIAGRSIAEQQSLARFASDAGADWLIFQPPLGEKPSNAALLRFFDQVMEPIEIPVGIQNVPEFLGCGLEAEEMLQLHRQQSHFTVMKGEGPVVMVKRFLDHLGDAVSVFNGRGGLEIPDNLRAGCAGVIPAPDCADWQVKLFKAEQQGDQDLADSIYRQILPYIVFIMQSINFHVTYGKRLFARRAGIDGGDRSRVSDLTAEPFFEQALARWSREFGPIDPPVS